MSESYDPVRREDTEEVHIRLEMELADFYPRRGEFLRLLSRASGARPEELGITDIRTGCVIVVVRMPRRAAQALIRRFKERRLALAQEPDFFGAFTVEQVREEIPLRGKMVMARPSTKTVDWLHLSDLHVRGTADEDHWYDDLCRDLPDLLARHGLRPRFVLVSGDVAFSGLAGQYLAARGVIENIRGSLPFENVPVICCPGNHDIEWAAIDPDKEQQLRTNVVEKGPDNVIERIFSGATDEDIEDLKHLMDRHSNFATATANWNESVPLISEERGTIATGFTFEVDGTRIAVATLNSALLSSRDDLLLKLGVDPQLCAITPAPDVSFLALSELQLREAARLVSGADVRLAIMHHPPLSAWFSEVDQVNHRTWLPEFDVVHRGHVHTPSNETRSPIGLADSTFEIAAGALHTTPSAYTGFTVVSVDQQAGTIRTTNFTLGERVRRWHLDTLASSSGSEERVLGEPLRQRLRVASMAAAQS
jgi:hypothetical protein